MLTTIVDLLLAWLPIVVIAAIVLISGRRLSRQYQENIQLSREAVSAIRENTAALKELSGRIEPR